MKKTLLLLGAMVSMLFAGMGQALAQITFEELNLTNGQQYTDPFDGGDFTATFSGGNNDGKYYTTGKGVRVYTNGKLTIKAKKGAVKSFKLTCSGSYKPEADKMGLNGGTFDFETLTWRGNLEEVVLTNSSSQQWRVQKIEATVDPNATPDVVEVTYTDATIESLNALTANKENVRLTLTNARVVYVQAQSDGTKKTYYVREGDKAIQFYKSKLELPENQLISGTVLVDYVNYRGIHEVTDKDVTNVENLTFVPTEDEVLPVEATLEDILASKHVCDYVSVKGVTITARNGSNFMEQGDKRVILYHGLDVTSYIDDGKAYDIKGLFNAFYQGTPEVEPLEITENQTVVVVPTPKFLTEEGSYESQVEVSIEVPEGCNVFYTTDGTEPDDSKTLYEAPFVVTETTTVKAVCYDENDQKSAVVEATYTITQPVPVVEGESTSFNFVANEWQLPVSTGQAQDAGNVTEVEVNGVKISFVFDAEGTGAKPRLWQGNTYTDLRVYKDQQIVAVAAAGKAVAQVKFYGAQASDLKLADLEGNAIDAKKIDAPATVARRAATAEQSKAVATYTPSEAAQSVGVKATATTKITEIEVISVVDTGVASVERSFVGNKTYDLQGRRVMNAQKGIFIQNGQKIIK